MNIDLYNVEIMKNLIIKLKWVKQGELLRIEGELDIEYKIIFVAIHR